MSPIREQKIREEQARFWAFMTMRRLAYNTRKTYRDWLWRFATFMDDHGQSGLRTLATMPQQPPRVLVTRRKRFFRGPEVRVLFIPTGTLYCFGTQQEAADFIAAHLPGEPVAWT